MRDRITIRDDELDAGRPLRRKQPPPLPPTPLRHSKAWHRQREAVDESLRAMGFKIKRREHAAP
jgi:hypothetical protein